MQLMGSKLEASLAIEGKFSGEGLLAMTQGEDMTTTLARTLVEGLEGQRVEEIWSHLSRVSADEGKREPFGDGLLFYVDPEGAAEKTLRRRRKRTRRDPGQMSLFERA